MKLKKYYLDHSKMKYFFKIILILIFTLGFNESRANTLFDSLNSAYLNNPKLNAERASMSALQEKKKEKLLVNFLPSITVSGYVSDQQNNSKGTGGSDSNFKPTEQSMQLVEQKIFQGFSGVANLKKKRNGQNIGEF